MKLTGGQIVIKYLEKEGVPYVLGIPGHGILALFDALAQSEKQGKIKYMRVVHEQSAVHIADGYFRIKGEPLAVMTSIGPGALNTAIGLGTAYVDSSAVFQVSGDTHVSMKGVGVLQEIERYQDSNFIRAMEPLVKRVWRAESARQLPRIMQRAFRQMLSGRKGPVLLSLPMDVGADEAEADLSLATSIRRLDQPSPGPKDLKRAARLMASAKRPVILVGGGMFGEESRRALQQLAETWGAAVVTTMAGKSAFPEDHPLYAYHTGAKGTPVGIAMTSKADVVLALGTRFADETTCSYRHGKAFCFPDAKLIHVDLDPQELGKNYACDVALWGDATKVAAQLTEALAKEPQAGEQEQRAAYHQELLQRKVDWQKELADKREKTYEHITISQLMGELNVLLPEDAIIATSSGNTQAQLLQEFTFRGQQRHLTSGGFSTMGWSLPAAIGAKLASPERPVFALMGDGDFMMTMQELSTLAQYNIKLIILVANNAGWLAIKDLQQDVFGEEHAFGNDFEANGKPYSPDFVALASSFGLRGEKISRQGELQGALQRAMDADGSTVIEVTVCREYPASGGKAYGWWDVPIPAYMLEKRKEYLQSIGEERV